MSPGQRWTQDSPLPPLAGVPSQYAKASGRGGALSYQTFIIVIEFHRQQILEVGVGVRQETWSGGSATEDKGLRIGSPEGAWCRL